jgi:hypothetical protein
MILETYTKQPSEYKDYDIDYSVWLADPVDTLFDITTTVECVTTTGDTALAVQHVDMTQQTVKLWVAGGTNAEKYKITINATTTGGRIDQSELIFKVKEV